MTTAAEDGNIPTWTQGDRLRKAREWAGLDQDQLADRMGVSRGSISNYERDKGDRLIVINAWALSTGVPKVWLLTGERPGPDEGDVRRQGLEPRTR